MYVYFLITAATIQGLQTVIHINMGDIIYLTYKQSLMVYGFQDLLKSPPLPGLGDPNGLGALV